MYRGKVNLTVDNETPKPIQPRACSSRLRLAGGLSANRRGVSLVMNQQQYADYQAAVATFLEQNKVKPGCHGPLNQEPEPGFEPFFSWQPCECCQSPLGGNRESYRFATHQNDLFEANICTECVYYLAYGQLDDMTMLQIEDSKKAQVAS